MSGGCAGDGQHVLGAQIHPPALVFGQPLEVVAPAPVQHFPVEIHPDRPVALASTHPLAGNRGGAAKILPQETRGAPAQGAVGAIDEVDLRAGILDRQLVELEAVGEGGGRRRSMCGFRHGWALYLAVAGIQWRIAQGWPLGET